MDPNNRESLSEVAGPSNMAAPPSPRSQPSNSDVRNGKKGSQQRPGASTTGNANGLRDGQSGGDGVAPKKRRHRGGKKKRNRRMSFLAPSESTATGDQDDMDRRPSLLDAPRSSDQRSSFYRLRTGQRSNTSLESEALLDHREHVPTRPRRRSNSQGMMQQARNTVANFRHRPSNTAAQPSSPIQSRTAHFQRGAAISEDEDEDHDPTDRTPLLGNNSFRPSRPGTSRSSTGLGGGYGAGTFHDRRRRKSSAGSPDSRKKKPMPFSSDHKMQEDTEDYDVNNPPSVPGSPKIGSLGDVMIPEDFDRGRDDGNRDAIIDIDRQSSHDRFPSHSPASSRDDSGRRRKTVQDLAEMDVCYPGDAGMSELGEEEDFGEGDTKKRSRRSRRRCWPDLDVLEQWSMEEKQERDIEQIRAKKMTEPVMVAGRLRPSKQQWHRQEDDAPYRYTYFVESFDATIHSRTISELCQFGATFKDLFNPEAAELSESESEEEEHEHEHVMSPKQAPSLLGPVDASRGRASVATTAAEESQRSSAQPSGSQTPVKQSQPSASRQRQKRYGPRPTFWLDVLSPTEEEMKVLAKAFGIHQLTVEDILMQEPREKVELFQNYYFVNYRSFEQDKDSEDYLEPINLYVVVFREGVISFHFSMTPHPANVRRRIRQLNDYMSPSADWISYAVIDDVTDAFAPLVEQIEEEVDVIDDKILALHSDDNKDSQQKKSSKRKDSEYEKQSNADTRSEKDAEKSGDTGTDMLRRVGECRKKVMSLYRLLGNKADVIKGFAKRCNEQWEVAPRSEIGLYLGDIQDHIITMTGNLSHYENLLSRAHSNYLAQINILMNERAEKTNDVLGKLTVLGTIVLPMNIVTGLWGMNTLVPGQDVDSLTWFFSITGGLFAFGIFCYVVARKVYGVG